MDPKSMLIAVFSFNRGKTLRNCMDSISRHCHNFDVILCDDSSDEKDTLAIIDEYRNRFVDIHISTGDKTEKRHGNLYSNIKAMCEYGIINGYRFLFMVQDDMQFVRTLTPKVFSSYTAILEAEHVLQVDPRFLRRLGSVEILAELKGYCFPDDDYRRSYADVGILDLEKISRLNWTFLESEKENKKALHRLGMLRVFPFSPVMMHVPFPKTFRRGDTSKPLTFLRKGSYRFVDMTPTEISAMDSRSLSDIPYFRDYLRPENLGLAQIYYKYADDSRLFR